MKTVNVSQAEGPVLDWLVAKAKGDSDDALESYVDGLRCQGEGDYSTNWSQGGPIIELEEIGIKRHMPCMKGEEWEASGSIGAKGAGYHHAVGPTPLIAAMRCYVASKLGEEVEIPNELIGELRP